MNDFNNLYKYIENEKNESILYLKDFLDYKITNVDLIEIKKAKLILDKQLKKEIKDIEYDILTCDYNLSYYKLKRFYCKTKDELYKLLNRVGIK